MRSFNISILAIILLSSIALSDTTWVEEGDISGVWGLDGSPYLILNVEVTIPEGDTLSIEPGVDILFGDGDGITVDGATLRAIGTFEDSISFAPLERNCWDCIFCGGNTTLNFEYCSFIRQRQYGQEFMGAINVNTANQVTVRNCTFQDCITGISTLMCLSLIVEHSYFLTSGMGIYTRPGTTNCIILKNVFFELRYFPAVQLYGGIVGNCAFIECSVYAGRNTSVEQSYFICRNIDESPIVKPERAGDAGSISYNTFYLPEPVFHLSEDDFPGFGILDRVNLNGDSTDRYGNLLADPMIFGQGGYPDYYQPIEASPCIDAGNPDSDSDPDSTIADIGAFYYPQPNIRAHRQVEFTDIQTGVVVEREVEIRNVGRAVLRIDEISIDPPDGAFGYDFEWEDILPDSSAIMTVGFLGEEETFYEANLYIESNDRDESIFAILLRGNALSVGSETTTSPTEFTISTPYPNPFNSSTRLDYSLPAAGRVVLRLYDLNGRMMDEMDWMNEAGRNSILLDAEDLTAGVYILELRCGREMRRQKAVVIK